MAHVVGGTRGAYDRTDLLDVRRTLMDDWARYLEQPPAKIVDLAARRRRTSKPAVA
jgi:hypothetical protein